MKTKRFVSPLLALLLICGLPLSAFAEEYDLATGSITVTADEGGQYVTVPAPLEIIPVMMREGACYDIYR